MDIGERARERCPTNLNRKGSSVSTEQKVILDAILRQSAFPADSDINEQRRRNYKVTGPIAGNGSRAFHHPVRAHTPGS